MTRHKQGSHELGRVCDLAVLILEFAAGDTWLMRAPLRVAYWCRFGDRQTSKGASTKGRLSSVHLSADLAVLDRDGIIRRHPGCIEILSYAALVRVAEHAAEFATEPSATA